MTELICSNREEAAIILSIEGTLSEHKLATCVDKENFNNSFSGMYFCFS